MNRADSESADEACFDRLGEAVRISTPPREIPGAKSEETRAAAGVLIHRNNVRSAYLRVLQEAFPVVRRLVGDGFFRFLAHEYFDAHPPVTPLVARFGDSLPGFLDEFAPASRHPYLADVALLEIAWLQSYHAADAKCLDAPEIVAFAGEGAVDARFDLHPSLRLIKSRYPIHEIWLQNRSGKIKLQTIEATGEAMLTVRPDEMVLTRALSEAAYIAIDAIGNGLTFGAAVERALSAAPDLTLVDVSTEIFSARIVTAVHPSDTVI